jgi:hypothetical protein
MRVASVHQCRLRLVGLLLKSLQCETKELAHDLTNVNGGTSNRQHCIKIFRDLPWAKERDATAPSNAEARCR